MRINIHENTLVSNTFVAVCKSFFYYSNNAELLADNLPTEKKKKKERVFFPFSFFIFEKQLML